MLLTLGAIVFLFPFYYMIVGSFATRSDGSPKGLIPGALGLDAPQLHARSTRRSTSARSLLNSAIFTGGVLVCTLFFGTLAGYALARLHFRGRGLMFASMLLLQAVPFQLLIIPLYVLVARDYGLADNYLGMIAPFAINSTAVFVFRQYFLQLPPELFEAARIDGASELRMLWSVALPLVQAGAAHRRAADVHRPVERVPVAVPDHQAAVACSRWPCRCRTTSPPRPRPRTTRSARSSPAPACWRRRRSRCSWCSSASSCHTDLGSGVKG